MDGSVVDWRDQLQLLLPVIRRENVITVVKTLERYYPSIDEEGSLELQKIAQRFEETAYATATGLSHYQEKLSSKMHAIENANDWRISLAPESRTRIINKIFDTLKRHLPVSGKEGLHELQAIAQRFEEKIFTVATSQADYLRKISLKMLTMETKHTKTLL